MNLTMEMIEQVIDATGADYYTVKEALTDQEGNVEEAIKAIQARAAAAAETAGADPAEGAEAGAGPEAADGPAGPEAAADGQAAGDGAQAEDGAGPEAAGEEGDAASKEYADSIIEKLRDRIKAGNVDKIRLSREGKVLLEVPVNVGMIGGILGMALVPWAAIFGLLVVYGLNCDVEIITADGKKELM